MTRTSCMKDPRDARRLVAKVEGWAWQEAVRPDIGQSGTNTNAFRRFDRVFGPWLGGIVLGREAVSLGLTCPTATR